LGWSPLHHAAFLGHVKVQKNLYSSTKIWNHRRFSVFHEFEYSNCNEIPRFPKTKTNVLFVTLLFQCLSWILFVHFNIFHL
jgi:hypothetical protein